MADLIDRDKLFNYVQKEKAWKQSRIKQPRYEQGLYDAWYEMLDIIKAQPTVDTERHAHWLFMGDVGVTKCSNCDRSICECLNDYEYCPHCGCRMDEVQND